MNESEIRLLELERLKIAPTGPVFHVIFAGDVTCTCRDWQRTRIKPGGWFVNALRIITRASGKEVFGDAIQEELKIGSSSFQKLLRAAFGSELVKKKKSTWKHFHVTHCNCFGISSETETDYAMTLAIRKRVGEVLKDHIIVEGSPSKGYRYCSTISVDRKVREDVSPVNNGPSETEIKEQSTEETTQRSKEIQKAADKGITDPLAMQTFSDYYLEGDSKLMKKARGRLGKEDRNELTDEDRENLPDRETAVGLYLDFFGRFGHLVEMGALPLRTFEGASGNMCANVLRYIAPEIRKRQSKFNSGEGYWHAWLVNALIEIGYLNSWDEEAIAEIKAIVDEFLTK
jgi:hypothetical protein